MYNIMKKIAYKGCNMGDFIAFHQYSRDTVIGDVWVIGDVHGCADQFETILELITNRYVHFHSLYSPRIYQLGDLIDRGPDLLRVFRLCEKYNVRLILGNHELNFIQERLGNKQCRSVARRATHDLFDTYSQEDQEFILDMMCSSEMYKRIQLATGETWNLSHAPIKRYGFSSPSYCMNSSPAERQRNVRAAYGHQHWDYTPIADQVDNPNINQFNVDGGCCYGGELVALELDSLQHITVPGVDYGQ